MENVFSDTESAISLDSYVNEPAITKPIRSAFVFINTDEDSVDLALDSLKQIDGVNEVYLSRGAYDIVAKVSGESMDHLREIIFHKIKNVSTVKSTLTLTVI
jgi:Lrp/AsnC family transcriptional regulator, regulator for asnA, asnC and gidA